MSTPTAQITLNLTVVPRRPQLAVTPGALNVGMTRGKQTVVEAEIANTGSLAATGLRVVVPAAPWLSLVTPGDLGDLAPGATAKITLLLTPPANLPLGLYTGTIVVTGANASLSVPFRFVAVSEGRGDLRVVAEDEFTYFAEDRPRVAGARVVLRDASTDAVVIEGTTGADGVLVRQGVVEGFYNLEVSAERHGTYRSSVAVVAGRESEVRAFLPRQLVTYRWTVEPINTPDRYLVNLQATFETDVPAPVVTASPLVLDLRAVTFDERGEAVVNYTLSNQGLIAANDVRIAFEDGPGYRVEPLTDSVGALPAKGSVVVPVTIRRTGTTPRAAALALDGDGASANRSSVMRAAEPAAARESSGECGSSGSVSGSYPCGGREVSQVVPLTITNGACSPTQTPSITRTPPSHSPSSGGGGGGGGGRVILTPVVNYSPPSVSSNQPCDASDGGGDGEGTGGNGRNRRLRITPNKTLVHVGQQTVFRVENAPAGQRTTWTSEGGEPSTGEGETYSVRFQQVGRDGRFVVKAVVGDGDPTTATVRVFKLIGAEAKRTDQDRDLDEDDDVYDSDPIRFCTDDRIIAKAVLEGAELSEQEAQDLLRWEVRRVTPIDGTNVTRGTGKITPRHQNAPQLTAPGNWKVMFYLAGENPDTTNHRGQTKDFEVKNVVVHRLSVARHVDVNINSRTIQQYFNECNTVLRKRNTKSTNPEQNDVRCCVRLEIMGEVAEFGRGDDNIGSPRISSTIRNEADRDRVYDVPFDIKFVESILFCGPEPVTGAIGGCTRTGTWNMILTPLANAVSWAHEFGHAQDLQDVSKNKPDSTLQRRIMYYAQDARRAAHTVVMSEALKYEGPRRPPRIVQLRVSVNGGPPRLIHPAAGPTLEVEVGQTVEISVDYGILPNTGLSATIKRWFVPEISSAAGETIRFSWATPTTPASKRVVFCEVDINGNTFSPRAVFNVRRP